MLDQQFPPTNHDRLHMENKLLQQNTDKSNNNNCSKLTNNVSNTASPAHLQNVSNNSTTVVSTSMPPPANVGLLPIATPPPSMPVTKNASLISTPAKTIPSTTFSLQCPSLPSTAISDAPSSSQSTTAVSTAVKSTQGAATQVIYRSYFERDDDALSDEFRFVAESFIEYSNSSTYSSNNNNTTNSSVTAKFQNLLQM